MQNVAIEKCLLTSVGLTEWHNHQRQTEHDYYNEQHGWKDEQNGLIHRDLCHGVLFKFYFFIEV